MDRPLPTIPGRSVYRVATPLHARAIGLAHRRIVLCLRIGGSLVLRSLSLTRAHATRHDASRRANTRAAPGITAGNAPDYRARRRAARGAGNALTAAHCRTRLGWWHWLRARI